MRALALVAAWNEERFIAGCLDHLLAQGVEVYLLDNDSTDRIMRRVAVKLALPLRDGDVSAVYVEDELAPSCPPPRPDWEQLIPGALAIYLRLEERADLSSDGEPVPAGRQRQLLQGSELLLHALLEARSGLEPTPPEYEVRREFVRLRLQEESLRARFEDARGRVQVLREIESSRSSAFIRAWWRLRKRLPGSSRGDGDPVTES